MKTYEVTLARLAWIKGSVTVKAESWGDAFVKAKAIDDQAAWPVDENGDTLIGFGDVEIDSAYCPSEADGYHEGEAPAADVEVYRAAPQMLQMLVDLLKPGATSGATIEAGRDMLANLGRDVRKVEG